MKSVNRQRRHWTLPATVLGFAAVTVGCRGASTPAGEAGSSPAANATGPATNAKTVAYDLVLAKPTLMVTSPDIQPNASIPDRFTDYGDKQTPTVRWTRPPAGTKSQVFLIEDPDAPGSQPFVHWLVYALPPTATSIGPKLPSGAQQGMNSNGSAAYFGPHPPNGDPAHHYYFEVFAIDRQIWLAPGANRQIVVAAMTGHTLAKGEMVATYQHK